MFNTPVLLIIFNRPTLTFQTFDEIKKIKPKKLFIAADGPRTDYLDDVQKCNLTRKIVDKIDWECDLHTLFRKENLGCGYGPSEAITWFFENVDSGIILEDDCLPNQSFFFFCNELLERYKDDKRVGVISGFNRLPGWSKKQSYIFTYFGNTIGWATWKDRWDVFDYKIYSWKIKENIDKIKNVTKNDEIFNQLKIDFDYCHDHDQNHIWDYQWLYCRLLNNFSCLVPSQSLIKNIGFNNDATHTSIPNHRLASIEAKEIKFPLIHGTFHIDRFYEWMSYQIYWRKTKKNFFLRLLIRLIKDFKKLDIM